jgi:hypothetical protein
LRASAHAALGADVRRAASLRQRDLRIACDGFRESLASYQPLIANFADARTAASELNARLRTCDAAVVGQVSAP